MPDERSDERQRIEQRRANAEQARRFYFPKSTCDLCDPVYVDATTIIIKPFTVGTNLTIEDPHA